MPHDHRTREEELVDGALLLCLLARVGKLTGQEYVGDRLKVMKLAFLATHEMDTRGEKGFNFKFYRWKHGPFSKDVCASWDALTKAGLLAEDEEFRVTSKGGEFGAVFQEEVLTSPTNNIFSETINKIVAHYGRLRRNTIMARVYNMRVVPCGKIEPQLIKDIPEGWDLILPLNAEEIEKQIAIDRGWLETLALVLSPERTRSLQRAEDDFAHGRFAAA